MVARKVEELVVWQLGCQLGLCISEVTARNSFEHDRKLRDQLRSASNSITANTAEGFGRYRPREFAQFARYANASANEIRGHLKDALNNGHIDGETFEQLSMLSRRTSIGLMRLIRYLESCPPDGPLQRDSPRFQHGAHRRITSRSKA